MKPGATYLEKGIPCPEIGRAILWFCLIAVACNKVSAQCPANIDFEQGTFNGWQCWDGTVEAIANQNQITLHPLSFPDPTKHIMLSANPGDGLDQYGKFPRNCPNGSGHSIQLGNDQNGHYAQGLSYQFTIPPTADKFKLLVNYALVMQDPDHKDFEQPRFEIEAKNITDNMIIPCPTNNFIAAYIPGMKSAAVLVGGVEVYYKDWSGFAVNLDGNAGKTIRLFFRAAGCAFIDHFGYAYIDVNTSCDGGFGTAAFCPTDTMLNLRAPSGFSKYTWFNTASATILGEGPVLHLQPVPPPGTAISVEIKPFDWLGCIDTLTTIVVDTLTVKATAGPDVTLCNAQSAMIGSPPVPWLTYSWQPSSYLSNPSMSNPVASPPVTTQYTVTVRSEGGGCVATDDMKVFAKLVDTKVNIVGAAAYCIGSGPFPYLRVSLTDSIQWFRNAVAIAGAKQTQYTVTQTGNYYAQLYDKACRTPFNTKEMVFTIDTAAKGITYPAVDVLYNAPHPLQARQFGNSVAWSPPNNLNDPSIYTPVFSGTLSQLYTIAIKTATGCITVDTLLVKTHKQAEIFVPNAFTPDGNGSNDRLRPVLTGFARINYFRVYDRWGKLLFNTNSIQPGWDGKLNNQPLSNQVLVWTIEAVDIEGVTHTRQGTTLLLR